MIHNCVDTPSVGVPGYDRVNIPRTIQSLHFIPRAQLLYINTYNALQIVRREQWCGYVSVLIFQCQKGVFRLCGLLEC